MTALRRSVSTLFVVMAWPLLAAGYLLQLLQLTKLRFFSETPSLLSIIAGLTNEKDYFLASILIVFTLFFPISKLTLLTAFVISPNSNFAPITKWLARLGKWSMLDVLVLALGVHTAHRSGFATAASQPGAWCFVASIILTACAAEIVPVKKEKAAVSDDETAASNTL